MNLRTIKAAIPWQLKIGGKLLLARVPVGYAVWQRLQLFRHGAMTDPGYAEQVFGRHLEVFAPKQGNGAPVFLELGPGDSLLSALLAYRAGAAHTWLVDAGAFAVDDPALYRRAARQLQIEAGDWDTRAAMLHSCRAEYLTSGLESLRGLPEASVDFIWSQAVLEHVRRHEFPETMRQLRRILRPTGLMSHVVDFKDHLGGKLNSLRFAEQTWEGDFFARSGFYTNRLRLSEMIALFAQAGFRVEIRQRSQWPSLPTSRRQMNHAFAGMADDDLLTSDAHLVAEPV